MPDESPNSHASATPASPIIEDPAAREAAAQLLAGIEKIPTLPAVPMKILSLVDDPKSSVNDLQRFIMMDQSLTARILKISNSAFYGFARQISTVSQAVVILGYSAVKSLALSASVVQLFAKKGPGGFDLPEFWKHSIFTGAIANAVAVRVRYPLPEEGLAAGILHGVGKLILDQYCHDKFDLAVTKAQQDKRDLSSCEREVLGLDHSQIGALLAERWKLPPQLVESIRYYENPGLATLNQSLVALVHLGNHVAREKKFGNPGDRLFKHKLSTRSREILKLSQVDVMQITHKAEAELPKVRELISALLD